MTSDEAISAAKSYAMTLLSRRAYTEKGLYDKLLTRCEEEAAAAAVARMIELGLLDDEDYARRHAADLYKLKLMPPKRIGFELARKGIDASIIEDVLSGFDDDAEPQIAKLVTKKYKDCFDDEKRRNKAVNALLRKGYAYGDIAAVLRNLSEDEDYYSDAEMSE